MALGLPPGFFLHDVFIRYRSRPRSMKKNWGHASKGETGEGREPEDLEIWMNFDDFYREF